MVVSYNKLWKLMIDRKMNKGDLRELTGMGPSTMAKLGKDETVSMDVIIRICEALKCDIGDVMEIIPGQRDNAENNNGEQ
jgi:putative transcriptional regulator